MPELKIYWFPVSQPARALKAFCLAIDAPHEERIVKMFEGEHKTEEIKALYQPAQIPFMTWDGKVLGQTTAMLRFLSQNFDAGKSYYPEDLWTRGQID